MSRREMVARFVAVMPEQSPIDRRDHARRIADTVFRARQTAARQHARHVRNWLSEQGR